MPPLDPPTEFDPRTRQLPKEPFVPATTVRVAALIEWFVEKLVADPYYRILFGEVLKHVVLGLLFVPPFLIFKWLSIFFDPTKDWFDWIAFYALRIIEIALILFAVYFVIVALLDAAVSSTLHRWRRFKMTKETDWPPH